MNFRLTGLILGALTALIAIVGVWSDGAILPSLWRVPAGLLFAGLAYESVTISRAKFALHVASPDHWVLGRSNAVRFVLRHQATRRLAVDVWPSAPAEISVDAVRVHASGRGAETINVEFAAVPRRLMDCQWPMVQVRVAGPLGLAWWDKSLDPQFAVRVQPDLLRSAGELRGVTPAGGRRGVRTGAGSEIAQLRRYRAGDPQRSVDWKASARTGSLVSRDFLEDQHLEIVIVVDAGRSSAFRAGALDRFGHYVNVAARLAQYAVAQEDLVGLVVFAAEPLASMRPARGAAALARLRAMLCAARVQPADANPLQAALRVNSLVAHRSLIVFLTDLDDVTVSGQLAAAARFLLPKHMPLIAGLSSSAAKALSYAAVQREVDAYRSLAAQEYCISLERNVAALRRLGAHALLAAPEQLERRIFDSYAALRRKRRV